MARLIHRERPLRSEFCPDDPGQSAASARLVSVCRIQIERLPHSRLRWRLVSDNSNGVILAAAVRAKTDARPPRAGFFRCAAFRGHATFGFWTLTLDISVQALYRAMLACRYGETGLG
jgi:hypothetical protein